MMEKTKCKGKIRKGTGWNKYYKPCPRNATTENGFCGFCDPDMKLKKAQAQSKRFSDKVASEHAFAEKARAVSACDRAVVDAADRWYDAPFHDVPTDEALMDAVDAHRKARDL